MVALSAATGACLIVLASALGCWWQTLHQLQHLTQLHHDTLTSLEHLTVEASHGATTSTLPPSLTGRCVADLCSSLTRAGIITAKQQVLASQELSSLAAARLGAQLMPQLQFLRAGCWHWLTLTPLSRLRPPARLEDLGVSPSSIPAPAAEVNTGPASSTVSPDEADSSSPVAPIASAAWSPSAAALGIAQGDRLLHHRAAEPYHPLIRQPGSVPPPARKFVIVRTRTAPDFFIYTADPEEDQSVHTQSAAACDSHWRQSSHISCDDSMVSSMVWDGIYEPQVSAVMHALLVDGCGRGPSRNRTSPLLVVDV